MSNIYCLNCGQLQTDVLTCCQADGEEAMSPQQMVAEIKRLRIALQSSELAATDSQQLKAEIAAHADLFEHELNLPIENSWQVAHDAIVFMRQLSAV